MTPLSDVALDDHPAWAVASASRLGLAESVGVFLAEEVPIALTCGGTPCAVMMGTPRDLEDFATGFAITDGLVDSLADIRDVVVDVADDTARVDLRLTPAAFRGFLATRRRRSMRGHVSCGLCGVEDLADIPRVGRRVFTAQGRITQAAVCAAVSALRAAQPLGRMTRATHAAVLANQDGAILLAREDVGRHNALDKLIGAAARAGIDGTACVCIITSRCSYEMVQKSVAGGIGTLVALSAPTALAVRLADAAGLRLIGLAASAEPVMFTGA